ncbi:M4 family metallopeptidase [Bacteroidota bacterium]
MKIFARIIIVLIIIAALSEQYVMAQSVATVTDISQKVASASHIPGFLVFKENINSLPENIFNANKQSFGLRKEDNLSLYRTDKDKLGLSHHRYTQQYKNIPIEGMEYIIHERPGKPMIGNGTYIKDIDLDVNPGISKIDVINISLQEINANSYMWENSENENLLKLITKDENASFYPNPKLVIIGPNIFPVLTKYHLAYKIEIYATDPISKFILYVDAKSGEILFKFDNMQYENQSGTAVTMYADTVQIVADHFPGGFRLREIRDGVSIRTLDANNTGDLAKATDFTDTDNYWNNVNRRLDQTATDVHWGTEMTFDYFKQVHNRNSINDDGIEMLSLVHVGTNWANASWNGVYMSYGDGNNSPLTYMAVVSHELTHGVTQYTANLIYYKESGALNESFSDIFGVSAMYWAGATNDDGSMVWNIVSRNLADPQKSGDPDTYLGAYWVTGGGDNGGVHTNSQVQNHWYYLLVEGGSGTNDNESEYEVIPIGIEKAEQIAYRTLVYYLTPASQYFDARNASLQATEDLYGMCSEEYEQVANAWHAVGVGYPVMAEDVGVSAVLSPMTTCEYLSNEENIVAELKYFGACETLPQGTTIPISFSVDNGDTLTENHTLNRTLEGGDTFEFTTNAVFDFSGQGLHTINIWTEYLGDTNIVNDRRLVNVYSGYNFGESYDISILNVLSPKTSCSEMSSEEDVIIELLNNGCSDIPIGTIISLTYKIGEDEVTEVLEIDSVFKSKSSIEYLFNQKANLSSPGLYDFEVSADYGDDPNTANNNLYSQVISGSLAEFPYGEDFDTSPGGWIGESLMNSNDWEWGIPSQQNIDTASSGEYAWMTNLTANYSDASEMVLLSPCFDFSNFQNPDICFDAFFRFETDFDGMILEYSTDNEDWSRVEVSGYNRTLARTVNFGIPWFSGTNSRWRTYCTFVPELSGEPQVRFRFRVGSDANSNDEGVAIDNFSIKQHYDYDLSVSRLTTPVSSCNLSDTEEIIIELTNLGSETILSFDVSYSINSSEDITETVSDTLEYGAPYMYTFNQTADLSGLGETYSIKATVTLADDAVSSNNSKTTNVTHTNQPGLPITEDFESGEFPSNWSLTKTGNSNGWTISDAETENARSAGSSWPIPEHTKFAVINDISLNYNRRNDFMILPPIDLTNIENPIVEFDAFYNDQLSAQALIKVSIDDGFTWVVIDSIWPVNYWQRKRVSLNDYYGQSCVKIAFHFDDIGTKVTGLAIDNVLLDTRPEYDCAVKGVYLNTGTLYTDEEKIIVEMENQGINTVVFNDITCIYNDGINPEIKFTEKSQNGINSGESLFYELNREMDFSDTLNYNVTIYQALLNDEIYYNDTLKNISFDGFPRISEFPYKETFDGFTVGQPGTLLNGWKNDGRSETNWWVNKGATKTYYTGPNRDHTGGNKLYMYVESSYPYFNKTADLYSPVFDISSLNIPYFKFWYNMLSSNSASGDVMGSLSVDVFDTEWHNDVWITEGNHGNAWNMVEINLRDFDNILKIRFRAVTGSEQFSDIAIDDVELYDKTKIMDVAITGLPKNGCGMTEDADINIKIENKGTGSIIDGIDLSYILDDDEPVTETYNNTLKSGEVLIYTFDKKVSLASGNHYFDFIIDVKGDDDRSNDSVFNHRVISYTDIFNYDEVIVCEGLWAIISSNHMNGYESFNWEHDPTAGKILYTDTEAVYKVSYTFENGCTLTDSVSVVVLPAPSTGLQDTTIYDAAEIDAGDFLSYLWQDGSIERTFYIDSDGLYYITVSDENGCFGTDGFEVKIISGVPDGEDNSLLVYPNPADGFVNVEIMNPESTNIVIDIIDIHGNILFNKVISEDYILEQVNISGFASGMYILKLTGNNVVKTRKLIIE